jgi:hypothetical protein
MPVRSPIIRPVLSCIDPVLPSSVAGSCDSYCHKKAQVTFIQQIALLYAFGNAI